MAKQLTRHLFNFFAVISLLIAFVEVVIWVRHHSDPAYIEWHAKFPYSRIELYGNSISFDYNRYPGNRDIWFHHRYDIYNHQFIGYLLIQRYVLTDMPGNPTLNLLVVLPYWWIVPPFMILPSIWLIRRIPIWLITPEGCCPGCGYDLRESRRRCPECGRVIVRDVRP